ncbi:hypothetical protein Q5752_000232 [Cryptotrichosporon argae]
MAFASLADELAAFDEPSTPSTSLAAEFGGSLADELGGSLADELSGAAGPLEHNAFPGILDEELGRLGAAGEANADGRDELGSPGLLDDVGADDEEPDDRLAGQDADPAHALLALSDVVAQTSRFLALLQGLDERPSTSRTSLAVSTRAQPLPPRLETRMAAHLARLADAERRRDEMLRRLAENETEVERVRDASADDVRNGHEAHARTWEDDEQDGDVHADEDHGEDGDEEAHVRWAGEMAQPLGDVILDTGEHEGDRHHHYEHEHEHEHDYETHDDETGRRGVYGKPAPLLNDMPRPLAASASTNLALTRTRTRTQTAPGAPPASPSVDGVTRALLASLAAVADGAVLAAAVGADASRRLRGLRAALERARESEREADDARARVEAWAAADGGQAGKTRGYVGTEARRVVEGFRGVVEDCERRMRRLPSVR